MSTFKKYASLIIFLTLSSIFLVLRGPGIWSNFKLEGQKVPQVEVVDYKANSTVHVFEPNQNYIVIFWASWCGPCIIEMNRFKKSVEEGKIPSSKILAINPFEDPSIIMKFIAQKNYPFLFVNDRGELAEKFKVQVTPTTIFVEKGVGTYVSSGVGFFNVFRAENLFN